MNDTIHFSGYNPRALTTTDKLWSWPVYATGLRQALRCKVHLLVVTPREEVARWCSKAIELGCGEIRPIVIGPAQIPVITDPDRATEALGLAVLSGLAHGHGQQAKDVGTALGEALGCSKDTSITVRQPGLTGLPYPARPYRLRAGLGP